MSLLIDGQKRIIKEFFNRTGLGTNICFAVCQDPSDIHCSQTLSSVGPVPRVHRFKRDGEVQRKLYLICLKAPSMGPNSPSQIPVVQY